MSYRLAQLSISDFFIIEVLILKPQVHALYAQYLARLFPGPSDLEDSGHAETYWHFGIYRKCMLPHL